MQAEQPLQGIMELQEKDEKYIGKSFKKNTKLKGVY